MQGGIDTAFIQRSCILTYPYGPQKPNDVVYTMGNDQVQQEKQTKHLGILRDTSQNPNIQDKINLGRRTAYSLMGAGFHRMNGLKQSVNGKLRSTYVIPRLLYGLEVQELKQSDINQLEQYQRKSLKQMQHLPIEHNHLHLWPCLVFPQFCIRICWVSSGDE